MIAALTCTIRHGRGLWSQTSPASQPPHVRFARTRHRCRASAKSMLSGHDARTSNVWLSPDSVATPSVRSLPDGRPKRLVGLPRSVWLRMQFEREARHRLPHSIQANGKVLIRLHVVDPPPHQIVHVNNRVQVRSPAALRSSSYSDSGSDSGLTSKWLNVPQKLSLESRMGTLW